MTSAAVDNVDVDHTTRSRAQDQRASRAAMVVFVGVEVSAFPLILAMGHARWFFNDDWDFLAHRSIGSVSDLLRPHYEHWVTLPIIAYRLLWTAFGARYFPYQVLLVLAHLTVAALLRAVMRRAGVGAWVATGAASMFAVFGAGYDNLFSAFQIAFVGSVLFGLVQIILVDHSGRIGRRDWLGLLAGLAALMCSLVGVPMVVAAGVAAFFRRGWRASLVQTVPLAYIFVAWWLIAGGHTYAGYHDLGDTLSFARIGITATFEAIGQARFLSFVVAMVLVIGLAFAWSGSRGGELRRSAAIPVALLLGALAFLLITGWGRSGRGNGPAFNFGPEHARESRYVYVTAALVLPAVAVAVNALIRRWKVLAPVFVALLAIGIIGNIKTMNDARVRTGPVYVAYKKMILTVPHMPRANELPRDLEPDDHYSPGLTVGWLLDSARTGKLPGPSPALPAADVETEFLLIALTPDNHPIAPHECTSLHGATTVRLEKGDVIAVDGPNRTEYLPARGAPGRPVGFGALLVPPYAPNYPVIRPRPERAVIGPLVVRVTPRFAGRDVTLCTSGTTAP